MKTGDYLGPTVRKVIEFFNKKGEYASITEIATALKLKNGTVSVIFAQKRPFKIFKKGSRRGFYGLAIWENMDDFNLAVKEKVPHNYNYKKVITVADLVTEAIQKLQTDQFDEEDLMIYFEEQKQYMNRSSLKRNLIKLQKEKKILRLKKGVSTKPSIFTRKV